MSRTRTKAPALVCPTCAETYGPEHARIGNRKATCTLCNRFGQAVRRSVARALFDAHPREAARLRKQAESDAYRIILASVLPTPEAPVGSCEETS